MSSLGEGSQRLAEASKAGETTLHGTSASGQTKIRQELQVMNKDFEEFRTHLLQAQSDLEVCKVWKEFDYKSPTHLLQARSDLEVSNIQ